MSKVHIIGATNRVERYIVAYEDAPKWGGPTMYPARPELADLKALVKFAKEHKK